MSNSGDRYTSVIIVSAVADDDNDVSVWRHPFQIYKKGSVFIEREESE